MKRYDEETSIESGSDQDDKITVASSAGGGTLSGDDGAAAVLHRRHRPFVSRHRRTLNRIQSDSAENRRHVVPAERPSSSDQPAWRDKVKQRVVTTLSERSCDDWVATFLPSWSWLRTYSWKQSLTADLIAGLTVGIMIVPQSMSYAKLAGLPVEYGLYSALLPVYAYAFFGSSRQLAVGPVALISLLLSTGLTHILQTQGVTPETNPDNYQATYNTLAVQTAFLVGVTYILMGICRLGFVTIFLSHAVISGFTTGAAVIIGISQVKYLVGYDIPKSDKLQDTIRLLIEGIDQFNYRTFVMGLASILLLVLFKHIGKTYARFKLLRAAGPLIVVTIAIVLTVTLDLKNSGIPVVGDIPRGFPQFTAPQWTPLAAEFGKLFLLVMSVVIVGFMESIAIAKQLASKHKYEIDASTELIGLGVSNFLGAAFNAYPVTGSFSRSAVNNESGAQSGISGIVTATLVCITLLFLTPLFEELPLNTLAAIVISGVIGLLDYDEAIHLWKVHKFDFVVWLTACLMTMFAGVEVGLAVAVSLSLLIVIYQSAYPQTSVMGRLPGTSYYRNVKQYPEAEIYDGIVIVRIDAPLYFANAQNVREKIRKYRLKAETEMAQHNGDVKYVILEMSPVSHIDTSALHQLEFMVENYRSRGQELVFVNPSIKVMDRLVLSGLADKIGDDFFFPSLNDAMRWCLTNMDCLALSIHGGSANGEDENSDGHDGSSGHTLMSDVEAHKFESQN